MLCHFSKISSHHYHCNNDAKDLRQFLSRLLDSCVVLKTLQHCSRQARTSVQPSFCKLTYFSNLRPKFANSTSATARETNYILLKDHKRSYNCRSTHIVHAFTYIKLHTRCLHYVSGGNCCLQALCRHSGLSQLLAVLQQSAAVSRVLQAPTHIQCSHPGTRHRQTVVPVPACV